LQTMLNYKIQKYIQVTSPVKSHKYLTNIFVSNFVSNKYIF